MNKMIYTKLEQIKEDLNMIEMAIKSKDSVIVSNFINNIAIATRDARKAIVPKELEQWHKDWNANRFSVIHIKK